MNRSTGSFSNTESNDYKQTDYNDEESVIPKTNAPPRTYGGARSGMELKSAHETYTKVMALESLIIEFRKEVLLKLDKREKEHSELMCVVELMKKRLAQEDTKVVPVKRERAPKEPKEETKGSEGTEDDSKSVTSKSSSTRTQKKDKQQSLSTLHKEIITMLGFDQFICADGSTNKTYKLENKFSEDITVFIAQTKSRSDTYIDAMTVVCNHIENQINNGKDIEAACYDFLKELSINQQITKGGKTVTKSLTSAELKKKYGSDAKSEQ